MAKGVDGNYEFGANWRRFLETSFSEERVAVAQKCLLDYLGREDLTGLDFIDVGCGSGLHSLAAHRSGARSVTSFDYDPDSVAATRSLHQAGGAPADWTVQQGSVLDRTFIDSLGRFDIVYSWGVLHHTGDLRSALANAARLVDETGRLYVALYASEHYLDTDYWLDLKRRYNGAGNLRRRLMEAAYLLRWMRGGNVSTLQSLSRFVREYRASRGMDLMTDVRDWLGGWPMEFSGVGDVHHELADKAGLVMTRVRTGEGNTEYEFMTVQAAEAAGAAALRPDDVAVHRLPKLRGADDLPTEPYLVFGTAAGARLLFDCARRHGRPPVGFVDVERTEHFMGLPVTRADALPGAHPADMPVVLSNKYVAENCRRLTDAGMNCVLNAHPLVVSLALGVRR